MKANGRPCTYNPEKNDKNYIRLYKIAKDGMIRVVKQVDEFVPPKSPFSLKLTPVGTMVKLAKFVYSISFVIYFQFLAPLFLLSHF